MWRLDRLGRSLAHLIDLAASPEARTVGFRSLSEGIDTTTPGGRLTFHLFGALAEFEQALISERTQKGLEAARARGRNGGRRRVMTAKRLTLARTMYNSKQYIMGHDRQDGLRLCSLDLPCARRGKPMTAVS